MIGKIFHCLFGSVKLVRNPVKYKFIYSGKKIVFVGDSLWSLDNDFFRNVVIFGADNTSSSHTKNKKNKLSGEEPIDGINDKTGTGEKKNVNFTKTKTKFCSSLQWWWELFASK